MIAVTGASGYIGRATLAQLAALGEPAVAVSRGPAPAGLPAIVTWRSTGEAAPRAAAFAGCDAVIHLAGRAHTKVTHEDGRDLFDEANRQLALATAAAAGEAGVRRFVFVSTLGVHGRSSDTPLRGDSPVQPNEPYARAKWAAERELAAACAGNGMDLCIVRPPMVYGPGCPGNFRRLVRLVATGLPLPFASLDGKRSFIHVDNLASFLCSAARAGSGPTGTYVVADGSDWTLPQLVRGIAAGLQRPARLLPFPGAVLRLAGRLAGREAEIDSLTRPMQVDAREARAAFGWSPPVAPAEALRQSVQGHGPS